LEEESSNTEKNRFELQEHYSAMERRVDAWKSMITGTLGSVGNVAEVLMLIGNDVAP